MKVTQNKSTLLPEERRKIANYLVTNTLPRGVGEPDNACSIAAINLALTGELTDDIPACMDPTIGRWIIGVQDAMPDKMRNSREWKYLLPLAAGTSNHSAITKRVDIIQKWRADVVLPVLKKKLIEMGMSEEIYEKLRSMIRGGLTSYAEAVHLIPGLREVGDRHPVLAAVCMYAECAVSNYYFFGRDGEVSECYDQVWAHIDPIKVLKDLIEAGE